MEMPWVFVSCVLCCKSHENENSNSSPWQMLWRWKPHAVLSDFPSACFHLASECCLLSYFYFKDCSFYFIQHFSCFQERAVLGISCTVLPDMELIIFLVPETFGVNVPYSPWFTIGSEHYHFLCLPYLGFSFFWLTSSRGPLASSKET